MTDREKESGGPNTAATAAANLPAARAAKAAKARPRAKTREEPVDEQGGPAGDAGGRGPTEGERRG